MPGLPSLKQNDFAIKLLDLSILSCVQAETFQQAFIKWKTQILYASKISEAWEMLDQKGGREDADHLVSVQDVIESFELVGEIFSIVIRPGLHGPPWHV